MLKRRLSSSDFRHKDNVMPAVFTGSEEILSAKVTVQYYCSCLNDILDFAVTTLTSELCGP